jgi:hypothetical protein
MALLAGANTRLQHRNSRTSCRISHARDVLHYNKFVQPPCQLRPHMFSPSHRHPAPAPTHTRSCTSRHPLRAPGGVLLPLAARSALLGPLPTVSEDDSGGLLPACAPHIPGARQPNETRARPRPCSRVPPALQWRAAVAAINTWDAWEERAVRLHLYGLSAVSWREMRAWVGRDTPHTRCACLGLVRAEK